MSNTRDVKYIERIEPHTEFTYDGDVEIGDIGKHAIVKINGNVTVLGKIGHHAEVHLGQHPSNPYGCDSSECFINGEAISLGDNQLKLVADGKISDHVTITGRGANIHLNGSTGISCKVSTTFGSINMLMVGPNSQLKIVSGNINAGYVTDDAKLKIKHKGNINVVSVVGDDVELLTPNGRVSIETMHPGSGLTVSEEASSKFFIAGNEVKVAPKTAATAPYSPTLCGSHPLYRTNGMDKRNIPIERSNGNDNNSGTIHKLTNR